MSNKNKLLISLGVIFIIIFSIVYLLTPRATIKLSVAPDKVFVSVNNINKAYKNGDSLSIKPGDYSIKVSADGFDTYTTTISIKNHGNKELLVALKPNTDAAKQLLLNDKSQAIMQRFYGKDLINQTDTLVKKYPIINILPINARLYSINLCSSVKFPNDKTKIALCVKEAQDGLDPYVLKDISSRGFNPDDYEIIWLRQYSTGE